MRPAESGWSGQTPGLTSVRLRSQALEVLTSAVEYGLDDLRKLCVQFLKGALSVELVCEALQIPPHGRGEKKGPGGCSISSSIRLLPSGESLLFTGASNKGLTIHHSSPET
nr:BTB/POZ domain-containing protein 19 isoform X1 [Pelodiscus sinensis]|eukprot:XP_025036275.1 BTB/POZ domain-containing protein 19 isoform X1 [Pelodiscus sinensis]